MYYDAFPSKGKISLNLSTVQHFFLKINPRACYLLIFKKKIELFIFGLKIEFLNQPHILD